MIGESQERVARAIRLRRMPGDVGVFPTTKIPVLLPRRRGPEAGDYMQPFSSPARFAAGASSTEGALI